MTSVKCQMSNVKRQDLRHKKKGRKFTRNKSQERALLRSLARAVIENESIITTEAKGKELRRFLEPAITKAKKGNIAARRNLLKEFKADSVKKLVDELAPRYFARPGGYLRLTKIKSNRQDDARLVKVELV